MTERLKAWLKLFLHFTVWFAHIEYRRYDEQGNVIEIGCATCMKDFWQRVTIATPREGA